MFGNKQDHSVLYSTVYFNIREQLWSTLKSYCEQQYNELNDPFFPFWQALACYKEGDPNESINILSSIQQRKEIEYATIKALKFYHEKCESVDDEAIQQLRYQEDDARKMSSDKAFVLAAYFYLFVKEDHKALLEIEQVNVTGVPSQTCEAWIYILHSEEPDIEKAFQLLESLVKSQSSMPNKPVETMMAYAQTAYSLKKFSVATDAINELIVSYPDFTAAQYEKAKISMMIAGWNDFVEISTKLVYENPDNILALKCQTFYTLARQGDIEYGVERLETLINTIFQKEPTNAQLMLKVAELFSRISGKNDKILRATLKLVNQCRSISPLNADYVIELANIYMMMEDYNQAYSLYQEAAALDDSKQESLSGMILCKIFQGQIDDAEGQIEFLKEVQISMGRTSTIAYLEGVLTSKKQSNNIKDQQMQTMKFIDEALKMHIMSTKNLLPTFQFYVSLNPDFLLQLSQIYLSSVGMKQMLEGTEAGNHYIVKGTKLLETVLRQIPGYITGYLLISKGKLALGDQDGAVVAINKVLEMDPSNEEAYILNSLIQTKKGNFQTAQHTLQEAISNNFQIRENPLFMLVKGEVEFAMKDYEASLATATSAFELNGVKTKINPNAAQRPGQKSSLLQFQEKDRCRIFLLLAKSYAALKKNKESKQIMAKAIGEWTGTEEEVNVLITNSEIAIQQGDIKKAIAILKGVKSDSQYFQQSRIILAQVHLDHLRDRRQFARCYTDLIEVNPSFENYKLLGDALLKIHEPEDASKAYEQALKINKSDEHMIKSLGKAYCQTYNYQKARAYYESELKQNQHTWLILDLAKLCIQIKDYQRAEELLKPQTFAPDDYKKQTIESLRVSVEGFQQMAKLFLLKMGKGNFEPNENVRKAYRSAIQVQKDVIEKCKTDGGDIEQQRLYLADLLVDLAEYTSNHEKNDANSLAVLEDAQKYLPSNEKILELKSKIYFRTGDKMSCEQHCNMLIKLNPNNDFASIMQAELLLQKDDYEQAIAQFKKILESSPTKYGILAKIIDFYRRQFNLKEAKKLIDKAQKAAINNNDAGLCFCRGLYYKYNRQPKEALSEFMKAKKVSQYAEDSIADMIDIYLNPDQDLYYSAVEDGVREISSNNIKACESLLRELQMRGSYQKFLVMECYIKFMRKDQQSTEQAVKRLTELVKQKTDYVPAMLCLAVGKLIMKKQTDAKNILKTLWKKPYTIDHAYELERAWLLYADTFVAIQKYDNAEEILKKCLKYNLSCGKAEEYMGLIKEKEHSYIDAAVHYEKAHHLSGEKSASVGFRLAFNYLKAKRYIDSINVCKSILKVFPDYPKIEKDVLVKARLALR